MANPEHVAKLKEGIAAWNKWRNENADVWPNLIGADLIGADLGGARLIRAALGGADLNGTDLSEANLAQANLSRVDLSEANLSRAHLVGVDFSEADLIGIDLSESNLAQADLSRAHLARADLSRAHLLYTGFAFVDLSTVKGLESCIHRGPSTINSQTLAQSDPLPVEFLRGCGLSDWEIEAAKLHDANLSREQVTLIAYEMVNTRFGDAIQYHSCFISYSSADEAFCRKLHDRLQDTGIRTWFAPEDMRGGRKLFDQVEHGIQLNDKLLLVLTEKSMKSEWVEFELRTALKREREENREILFPIRLVDYDDVKAWRCPNAETGADMAEAVRRYHILGDFENWKDRKSFDAAFDKLLRDLRGDENNGE